MSLDDTLRAIIADSKRDGDYELSEDEAIAQLKQAFADAGYISPNNAKKVQDMVNQMANLANDGFQFPTIQYIKPNKAVTKAQNLMTGQEWYDRYLHELKHETAVTDDMFFVKVAKRAAGLEESK